MAIELTPDKDLTIENSCIDQPLTNGISVVWAGNWSSNKSYYKNQAVFYQGSSYRANKTTTQTPSPSSTDWDILAQAGSGGSGGGASYLTDLLDVTITSPTNNQVLSYNSSTGEWSNQTISTGSGEVNTASNVGTAGVGVFKQKTGVELQFNSINAGSNKVSITNDTTNSEIDIDINEANLSLSNISGTLPISKGGTNATTASQALTNLGAIPSSEKASPNGVATLDSNSLIPDSQIPASITRDSELTSGLATKANTADLLAHINNTENPHSINVTQIQPYGAAGLNPSGFIPDSLLNETIARVSNITAAQVGNTTAQWNANQIQGVTVDNSAIGNGKVLKYNSGTNTLIYAEDLTGSGGGSGEVNTASNVGASGVSVYKQKTGVNFEFKSINSASNKITITDDTTNNEIDIDVNEANLSLNNLSGTLSIAKGGTGSTTASAALTALGAASTTDLTTGLATKANTADLTSHTSNTSNPHSTTAAQIGAIATTEKGAANGVATLDANTLIPTTQIPTSIARVNDITATQVGNTTAQWNANQIQGIPVSSTAPTNGQVLKFNGTQYAPAADNEGSGGGGSSIWDSVQFAAGAGVYYATVASVGNTSNISTSANQARVVPLIIRRACSIDRVRVNAPSGVAGGLVNVLLYNTDGNLVQNFGNIDVSASNLRQSTTLATPVSLQPGMYYWYVVPNVTVNLTGNNNQPSPIFGDIFGYGTGSAVNTNIGGFVSSFTFGTAPSSVTIPTMTSGSNIVVNYQVSSIP